MKAQADPAEALRSVPPRDFIRARDALAAQLTKGGRVAEARRVARLRRPGPVVWALNRAALARPRELAALVETVDRLRRAQLGHGDVRAAMEGYRTAFEPLVRGAHQVLREAGTAVTPGLDRRMRSTLLAAVTDRGLRAELGAGRLEREHADPGFAVLSRGPVPAGLLAARPSGRSVKAARPAPALAPPPTPPRSSESAATAAAKTRRDAREQARAARQTAREARSQALQAERAERAAQAAERRAAAMRRALAAVEEQSAKLRAQADEARGRVTGAAESPRPAQSRGADPGATHSRAPRPARG
jgi:hypothetical protein